LLILVKAFDTVWIKALILKLEKNGIKGNLLFWLKSYLSRRKQRVVIKDAISSTGECLRTKIAIICDEEQKIIPSRTCFFKTMAAN
jgi:hypothetical protein